CHPPSPPLPAVLSRGLFVAKRHGVAGAPAGPRVTPVGSGGGRDENAPLIRLGLAADPASPTRGKGKQRLAETFFLPSPLVGEGARRADEGGDAGRFARKSAPPPVLPADPIRGPLSAGAGTAGAHRLAYGSSPRAATAAREITAPK